MRYATKGAYRKAWDDAYLVDPPVPLNLDIELASACNLACPFCHFGESDFAKGYLNQNDFDGSPIRRFMPVDMALRIIDEAADLGIPALKMNFRGESTLHRVFSEICRYARGKTNSRSAMGVPFKPLNYIKYEAPAFYDILSNTNANSPDSAIDGLMACTKVMVSLDSCDPITYPKVRVNGKIERAFEVIRELKKRGHPDLWVRRVIAEENKHEDFVGDVKRIFGEDTKVSEHFAFNGRNKEYQGCQNASAPEDWERNFCGYPSQRVVITASGQYVPCCVSWRGEFDAPRWPETSIEAYWNGPWRRKLTDELRRNELRYDICKKCTSYMAYKRPERAYVKDVEGRAVL